MKFKPAKIIIKLILFSALFFAETRTVFSADAELFLSPQTTTIEEGQTKEIKIKVDTNGSEVGAVDIYMTYDPALLAITVGTAAGETDFSDFYPESGKVDSTAGEIIFAAFTSADNPVTGENTVATLKATAKESSSSTDLAFNFSSDSTTDCNVVERETVEDILASVTDGTYELTESETEITPTPTEEPEPTATPTDELQPTSTPAPTNPPSQTPETGIALPSLIFSMIGFFLFAGGIALAL